MIFLNTVSVIVTFVADEAFEPLTLQHSEQEEVNYRSTFYCHKDLYISKRTAIRMWAGGGGKFIVSGSSFLPLQICP